MPIAASDIAARPDIVDLIRQQSAALVEAFHSNPRLTSVFATQQRWLLAHTAMAQAFREGGLLHPQLRQSSFLEQVARHGIASRNTADAFLKEMQHYRYAEAVGDPEDRRARPLRVAAEPVAMLKSWVIIHLLTLDRLDGGHRLVALAAEPDAFAALEIAIADALLTTAEIRQPQSTFSLFTWLNNGGVIMDWLVTGLGERSQDGQRHATAVSSIADMAGWINLSRTHLMRKLREAERMGALGWTGSRGASAMWVSAGFVEEVIAYQSVKLAIIDAACDQAFTFAR